MSEKHEKGIVDSVEQDELYVKAIKATPEKDKASVKATLDGFAKMLGPMVEAVEKLEGSEEVARLVRERLAEKLRDG